MEDVSVLKNWGITNKFNEGRSISIGLHGDIYGHLTRSDGRHIFTSSINRFTCMKVGNVDCIAVKTRTASVYLVVGPSITCSSIDAIKAILELCGKEDDNSLRDKLAAMNLDNISKYIV